MYIQNATYKTVPTAGLTFPLAEGTVLTVGDVTGIVPENIALAAPTGLIYLATGGTIDLTSEANAGVTFTDEQLNELGGDFNFIPLTEAGGSSLPSYTSADKGKVLTVGEGSETTVIVPEQTKSINGSTPTLVDGDGAAFVPGQSYSLYLNGTEYTGVFQQDVEGVVAIADNGRFGLMAIGTDVYAVDGEAMGTTTEYTFRLSVSKPKLEPKWEAAGVVYTLSHSAGTALMTGIQSAVTTAATDGLAEANVTTGFDSDDVAMIEKMADDLSSGSPFVLQINGMDNTFSPVISSKTSTIGTKYVTFNIPLYRVTNMFFNIIITLNASDTLFSTISVIKLAST